MPCLHNPLQASPSFRMSVLAIPAAGFSLRSAIDPRKRFPPNFFLTQSSGRTSPSHAGPQRRDDNAIRPSGGTILERRGHPSGLSPHGYQELPTLRTGLTPQLLEALVNYPITADCKSSIQYHLCVCLTKGVQLRLAQRRSARMTARNLNARLNGKQLVQRPRFALVAWGN